jgi:hypothetical protein
VAPFCSVGVVPHPVDVTPPSFVAPSVLLLLLLDDRALDDVPPPDDVPLGEGPLEDGPLDPLEAEECDVPLPLPAGAVPVPAPLELEAAVEPLAPSLDGPVELSLFEPPPHPDTKATTLTSGRLRRKTALQVCRDDECRMSGLPIRAQRRLKRSRNAAIRAHRIILGNHP